ncbi:adenosine deaminase [Aureimonas pseudogalii]|uniref:Adenosine deaminase n=1 Tax=Aureimonas pseudogalii TaxID=1744844 RepID=A0A7W6H4K7_9HYPH|nr:adenosine deaminase [Aureimonas pseudogalii]MBB3998433.1 adenosine deaminase [Aureimonas pseudogalii]
MTLAERLAAAARERQVTVPLAELHVHLEGTASPALAREQARRLGVAIDDLVDGDRYRWQGFGGFLEAYDRVAALFRTPDDFRRLASNYLRDIAARGAVYAELFVSPDHARASGLDPDDYLEAVARGATDAEREAGIVGRLVVVGVRHLGPDAAEAAARLAAMSRHRGVTGFGLAGDERSGHPADFARAFAIAGEAALGLTAHAGEFAGPQAISETLDRLKVTRLGHGVRAVEDAALLDRLRRERIVLEVYPHSNLALGVYPDADAYPLRRLREAGLRLTVSSDDPPFFGTNLAREYAFAESQSFGPAERLALTRTALEAAFVEEGVRRQLLETLTLTAISLGAPGASL